MGLSGKGGSQSQTGGRGNSQSSIGGEGASARSSLASSKNLVSNANPQGIRPPTSQRLTPRANFLYKASAGDTFNLRIRLRFGSIYVYWGDGIIEELVPSAYGFGNAETFSHTYQKEGNYPVQLFYDSNELEYISILDDKNFFAHTSDFPTGLSSLRTRRTNTYGDIQFFPNTYFQYRIEHEPNVFGDITGWNNRSAAWFYGNDTNISGNVADIPPRPFYRNNHVKQLEVTQLEGDLSVIPQECGNNTYWLNSIKSAFYTGGTYQYDVSGTWIRMDNNSLNSSEVDQALIDLSNSGSTGSGFYGRFYIGGNNDPRTSTSDAAVNDLQSKGWLISVNT